MRTKPANKKLDDSANREELMQIVEIGLDGETPSPDDAEKVRAFLAANPGDFRSFGELASKAYDCVVESATTWAVERETVKERMWKLKTDLGYESSNVVEQMAITQVVLNWARLYFLEVNLSNATRGSHDRDSAHYWDRRTTMAQGRYMKALTSLAKIRKLKLPDITAIQANVAYVNANAGPTELQAKRLIGAGNE